MTNIQTVNIPAKDFLNITLTAHKRKTRLWKFINKQVNRGLLKPDDTTVSLNNTDDSSMEDIFQEFFTYMKIDKEQIIKSPIILHKNTWKVIKNL